MKTLEQCLALQSTVKIENDEYYMVDIQGVTLLVSRWEWSFAKSYTLTQYLDERKRVDELLNEPDEYADCQCELCVPPDDLDDEPTVQLYYQEDEDGEVEDDLDDDEEDDEPAVLWTSYEDEEERYWNDTDW